MITFVITFVLAAAVLVGALYVAVALDSATTQVPPPGVAAHVLAARLLATDHSVPVALSDRRHEHVVSQAGQEPAVTVRDANLTIRLPA